MEKKAFLFDTNFILENKDLKDVVKNLEKDYNIYITQVSIDERISQKYLELEKLYAEIPKMSARYKNIFKISEIMPFDKRYEIDKTGTQKVYMELFSEKIIPYSKNEQLFNEVLERVFKKIPPFHNVEGASDKGFKDTLMWLSILKYFKDNGENEVIFLTNDNGFRKHSEYLINEFKEYTGKSLEIKDNSYYAMIKQGKSNPDNSNFEEPKKEDFSTFLPKIDEFRDRIERVMSHICETGGYDQWGLPHFDFTFRIYEKVDAEYIEELFQRLDQILVDNIFSKNLSPEILFDNIKIKVNSSIQPASIEELIILKKDIENVCPQFLKQFYRTIADCVNYNYSDILNNTNDDIPF